MKIKGTAAAVLVGFSCCTGCSSRPGFADSTRVELVRPNPQLYHGKSEELAVLPFGGVYRIVKVETGGAARDVSAGQVRDKVTYRDGAIQIKICPVPYGVHLEIENLLPWALTLDGSQCTMLDEYHVSHQAELRPPRHFAPDADPSIQLLTIPPTGRCVTDLDIIMPEYRSYIVHWARTPEERGAFQVPRAPLPVFSSGYYVYPSSLPDIEAFERWALPRTFGVYIQLRSETTTYGYLFWIEPYRFAMGPTWDDSRWEDPNPTRFADEINKSRRDGHQ